MGLSYLDVQHQAEQRSKEEQAKLVNSLLVTLQMPVDPLLESEWLREVAERKAQYLNGEATLTDAANVFAKVRKILK